MSRNRAAPSGKRENVPEFLRAVYAGNNSPNEQDKVLAAFQELQDNEDRNQSNAMDDPTGEHPYSWSVAVEPDNRELNRYSNILPYNQTRVLLAPIRDPDTGAIIHDDYINASWVRPPGGIRSYIATQGPLQRTIVDFWRMVWQEKARVLVMLTDVYERGKVKCNVYWPERVGDVLSFDTAGLQIKLLSEEKALNGEAILRRMEITRRPPTLNTSSSSSSSVKASRLTSLTNSARSGEENNRFARLPRRSKDLGPPDQSNILLKDLRAPAVRLAPPPPRAPPARLGAHLQLSDQPPTTAGLAEAMEIPNKRVNSGINRGMGLSGSAPTAPPANFMLAKPPLPRKMKANKNLTLNTANIANNNSNSNNNSNNNTVDNPLQNKNTTLSSTNTTTNTKLNSFNKLKSESAPEPMTVSTSNTTKSTEHIITHSKPNKTQAAANLFRGIGDWFNWLTRVNGAQGQHRSTKSNSTNHSIPTSTSTLAQSAIARSLSLPVENIPNNSTNTNISSTVHQDSSTKVATNIHSNNHSINQHDQNHVTSPSTDNNNNTSQHHHSNKSKGTSNTGIEATIKPVQLTASQARNRMSAPPASAPLPNYTSIFTHDDDDVLMSPPPASAAVHDDKPDPSMLSPMIVPDQDPTAALEATAALISGEYHGHDNMGALAMSLEEHLGDEPVVQRAIVTQIHFLGWPDHGVPEQPDGVLRLIRLVNREQGASDSSGPVVVHCSAGCGRTGTFCVIDSAIAILTATRDGSVDLVHQLTRHFRTQRCTMVQTSQQYWFCYVAVLRRILTMLQRNRAVSL